MTDPIPPLPPLDPNAATRLAWSGADLVPPQCWLCLHYAPPTEGPHAACQAFLGAFPTS